MAARDKPLNFKDLIDAQKRLAEQGDARAQAQIQKLEALAASIDNQSEIQQSQNDTLSQAVQSSTDKDKLVKVSDNIDKTMKKAFLDKTGDGVNSNIIKMFGEIKKLSEFTAEGAQLSVGESKEVLGKSGEKREFKTIGQRIGGIKDNVKDFFSMRGFLDKTGIVERGSGGIFSEALDAREDRQKQAEARLSSGERARDPETGRIVGAKESRAIFEKEAKEEQQLRREQGELERTIGKEYAPYLSEEKIGQTPEAKRLNEIAEQLAKLNPSLAPKREDEGGVLQAPEDSDNLLNIEAPGSATFREAQVESFQDIDQQLDVLRQIEKNTNPENAPQPSEEKGGLLSGLGDKINLGKGMKSIGSRIAGGATSYLGKVGGLGTLAKGVGIGGVAALAGEGIQYGGDKLKEAGYEETGKAVGTAGTAAKYAGYGAMIGSVVPGVGTAIGAGVGGLVGLGKGIYDQYYSGKGSPTTTTESTSGTLTGVTGEQVRSHPNYKKYYDQAIKEGADKYSADEEATMMVKEDMIKNPTLQKSASVGSAAAQPKTVKSDPGVAESIYGKSAEVRQADMKRVSGGNTAVVNAPTTINRTSQMSVTKPTARNSESAASKFISGRYTPQPI